MIRVAAAIIEQNGRVLICQRRAGGAFEGKWEFPGGKMRPSEMPRQALERELREELGVASTIGDALGIVRHRYKEMAEAVQVVFVRASLEGTPRNLAFERIVWARRAELGRYDFLAADRRVIAGLAGGAFAFVRSLNPERRSLAQGSVRDGPAAVDRQNLSRHIRSAH